MDYQQFKLLWKYKDAILSGYNSADGTITDTTTDPVITRDPNNYLVPRIDQSTIAQTLAIIVAVIAIIILLPMAIKTVKSYV